MPTSKIIGFEISVSTRDDGTIEAAYIKLADGKVAKTTEISQDVALADYDAAGNLLGIEILAPVKLSQITPLVEPPRRPSFRKAVKNAAPRQLVLA
jgi:uncharacterized protein YuzE